jgi:hypothetical protein
MNDHDFCRVPPDENVDHTPTPEKLMHKVQKFLEHRKPEEAAHRASLKAWAENGLAKFEPASGGGATKIGTNPSAKASRKVSMFKIVIREIEIFDACSGAG